MSMPSISKMTNDDMNHVIADVSDVVSSNKA
jgi:hypothetical protein